MSKEMINEEVLPETIGEVLTEEITEDLPTRQNPFCVISKATYGEYSVRDIQSNSAWSSNPYGDDYAVVPDDMVADIMETRGFVDIELNGDGTEVVSFTALEIPEIPEPTPEPTAEDRIAELEAQMTVADEAVVSLYEMQSAQDEINVAQDEAITGLYEIMLGGE